MDIHEFLDSHAKVVLQFSAGKDSLACLKLLKPYWNRIIVLWANAGNAYPETLDYMDKVRKLVPHFVEVHGEQPAWVIEHGMPVDVVPVSMTSFGPYMGSKDLPLVQPFNACCHHNLWQPMADWIIANDVTGIIRGQKDCDTHKPPHNSGEWIGPFQVFHPIEKWTDEQVIEFCGDDIPDSYKRGMKSSLDCMSCSAYASHNKERIQDLDLIYPLAAKRIREIHSALRGEMLESLKDLEA
jgi:3'-phosphoadenosine 5'-phosphosulfate sulfotransferase (PAPS reductase)/FAD synthetase